MNVLPNPNQSLIIVGAGGFGREVWSWAQAAGWKPKGFLDDDPKLNSDSRLGAPWLGGVDEYLPGPEDVFICAIGRPALRRSTTERVKAKGGKYITLVHPTAILAAGAEVAVGVVVCPYALISADARVEEGAVIYYHTSIDHDVVVGAWSQISGHCDITGEVKIGAEVFVGSHASVLPRVVVGDGAIVGAGAVVTRDVPAQTTVMGVPARPLG